MEAFKFFMIFAVVSLALLGLRLAGADVPWAIVALPIIVYLGVIALTLLYLSPLCRSY